MTPVEVRLRLIEAASRLPAVAATSDADAACVRALSVAAEWQAWVEEVRPAPEVPKAASDATAPGSAAGGGWRGKLKMPGRA